MTKTHVEESGGRTSWRNPVLRFEGTSRASADAVYDLLEDLQSHLDWGGRRQLETTRLLTLEAPPGPAKGWDRVLHHRLRRQGGPVDRPICGHRGHAPTGVRVRHRRPAGGEAG